ncbi:hypothetical protein ANN_02596 [Periplaneta americana]|uniref:Uncharacterized protein n=1 Tax=Periplaneta americana TaxID=6978 RepID=A0ABQ8TWS6_PERAM|nr:hypothetical protein ANN_02596 [Periplaneta americana]
MGIRCDLVNKAPARRAENPGSNPDSQDFIFKQDGAPPYWHRYVRGFLNQSLPQRWIGHMGNQDLGLHFWPPRSPDLTPCDLFLWGNLKEAVYNPPLPTTLAELRNRVTAAVNPQ